MAEIKISELSIGDWISDKNGIVAQVRGIECWSNEYVVNVRTKAGTITSLTEEGVCPIPLTPEILEKNGLEYVDDDNDAVIFLCCDMFWARLCVGDTFWQVGIHSDDRLDAVVCNVKHTHQLQHALRLAGVEKEIEV